MNLAGGDCDGLGRGIRHQCEREWRRFHFDSAGCSRSHPESCLRKSMNSNLWIADEGINDGRIKEISFGINGKRKDY